MMLSLLTIASCDCALGNMCKAKWQEFRRPSKHPPRTRRWRWNIEWSRGVTGIRSLGAPTGQKPGLQAARYFPAAQVCAHTAQQCQQQDKEVGDEPTPESAYVIAGYLTPPDVW